MIVHAEDPQRTAAALAVLLAAPTSMRAGNVWTVGGAVHVLEGRPDNPSGAGIARLLLETAMPVEGVMEIACAHGFHAEELHRSGLVEFWIGEAMLIELVTSDATDRLDLAA
ncbi:hypothetical protein SCH01S_48_01740 [Sphingomonas changbaiensis NBRC 104936]|uniref:Uncharacterized protein n=1 Tax=Sphingomonas changbaiensis NBRC 104936 TaxID=1219043 RepID=A0A0E9MRX0_9SPHN|nr:hypothetical protein [Sphingomonas changbaiensis]GAO40512.1 hypothetical protein SCH01S_48_01740 [Sphingomonas changbaiensis NBRC 104936]